MKFLGKVPELSSVGPETPATGATEEQFAATGLSSGGCADYAEVTPFSTGHRV
jgi:hypothetical protein